MVDFGSALLSAFLQVLFDRVTSREVVEFLLGQRSTDGISKKMEIALLSLNAVLEDAEEKQVAELVVKRWLDELKDAVHDAEDILDEIAAKTLRRELDAEFQNPANTVRNSISSTIFIQKTERKTKNVLDRLEFLATQKDVIGLREGVGRKPSERLPTTSLVDNTCIFGREKDKEAIINLLVSDDTSANELALIAIAGMGGIGKTTLAQLVYNDARVEEHFDLQAWVCVSDEFDVFNVMKTILEEVGSSSYGESKNLNWLQVTLKKMLMGKKFLLVLDDVWDLNYATWELLSSPFKFGAQGSRVIVTTREEHLALVMRATKTYKLNQLPEEDCWSIFAKYALRTRIFDSHPELEELGRKIVKKCKGLPLAIKLVGSLLWSKLGVDEWNKILKSELWDFPNDIIPALRLSYKYLPSHLKRCFAYCSIFPKDYIFRKNKLVFLWMAEGFLPQSEHKSMEEVGNEYFFDLVSRSLFQQSSDNSSDFVMHDLVNDLARFVSGQFSFRLEGDSCNGITSRTRHLSICKKNYDSVKNLEALCEAEGLRTLLEIKCWAETSTKELTHDLLPKLRRLRVLSLSHNSNLTELPGSIGKMKHLRYLDVSSTSIERLPDSICELCSLQTLELSWCKRLSSLPGDIRKLVKLRHLIFPKTPIKEMPTQLGRLNCLQTLTRFIVSRNSGSCIGELGKLANLGGKLSISELQNVVSPTDALDARLKEKKYLEELELEWKADTNISESQKAAFDNLRPSTNLKRLTINCYGGKSFPDWIGNHSFSNIASINLFNCKHCCTLPPLGQLPSLQNLSIVGFDEIVTVGPEFYGNVSSSRKPFGALKVLRFESLRKWERWICCAAETGGGIFLHLEKLYIKDCFRLTGELPIQLSSSAIHELELSGCNQVLLKEFPNRMQTLEIGGFDAVESLPGGIIDSSSCLRELKVQNCCSLMSLSQGGPLSTLKTIWILHCRKLELPIHMDYSSLDKLWLHNCDSIRSIPLELFPKLCDLNLDSCANLESFTIPEPHQRDLAASLLQIKYCPKFVSFPKAGWRAPKLELFLVDNCGSLRSLPDRMDKLFPSLVQFTLRYCSKVESFPEGGLPSNLNSISVFGCDKLVASWKAWGLQKLPSLRSLFIGGTEDVESFPDFGLLPTSLISLSIEFSNLKSLDREGLQHLISLEELQITRCPELKYMPEEGLPTSISILRIHGCPLLEKQWKKRKGKEWREIAHVPQVGSDYKRIRTN